MCINNMSVKQTVSESTAQNSCSPSTAEHQWHYSHRSWICQHCPAWCYTNTMGSKKSTNCAKKLRKFHLKVSKKCEHLHRAEMRSQALLNAWAQSALSCASLLSPHFTPVHNSTTSQWVTNMVISAKELISKMRKLNPCRLSKNKEYISHSLE